MRFVLMCQVLDGEPPVRIRWLKDQQELTSEQLISPSLSSNLPAEEQVELLGGGGGGGDELGSSLLFRRVQQQHSGNYTCLATNQHGTSAYSSIMTVKGKWLHKGPKYKDKKLEAIE